MGKIGYYSRRLNARRRNRRKGRYFGIIIAVVLLIGVVLLGMRVMVSIRQAMYPTRYSELVEQYAEESRLDKYFVYAVIKCESGFNAEALSEAHAKGLMQLTDDTFVTIQKNTDGTDTELIPASSLFSPEVNIKYGTRLLRFNLDSYTGKREALVAYHAGRTQLTRWLADPKYSADGKTLDTIPFSDTESYVNNVLKAEAEYIKIYGE